MFSKKKNTLFAAIIAASALTGCGGGGGGSDDETPPPGFEDGGGGGDTDTPETETPSIDRSNSAAKALVNAPEDMSGNNISVAVADSGVRFSHNEFEGNKLDGQSDAFAVEFDAARDKNDLITSLPDDYRPDDAPGFDSEMVSHGTAVASLILGKTTGLISGGSLLAMDVMYKGSISEDTYNPAGSRPKVDAALLGVKHLSSIAPVDFANLSIHGVGEYQDPEQFSKTAKASRESILGLDTAVITIAGNRNIDFTEIYASNSPECTEEESESEPSGTWRCYALKHWSHEKKFIPYSDDELRKQYIFTVAVNNDGEVAKFSSIPGSNKKIQERFISAPGVSLSIAQTKEDDAYIKGSGTSYAAPIVTAAAVAVKSKFPALNSTDVIQVLLDTADNNFEGYSPEQHGAGILDIQSALKIKAVNYIGN